MKRAYTISRAIGAGLVCVALLATVNHCDAQVSSDNITTCRLVTEPSGARDDNNGGADVSTLIGLNTALVENFVVYQMDLSGLAGMGIQTSGATVTIQVSDLTNANHGQSTDTIVLNSCFNSNAGFEDGVGTISGADTPADDGSISFLNRVQFSGSGTTEPWMDAAGSPVANLLGAITPISTTQGYDQGSTPPDLQFTLDAATAQDLIDNGTAAFVVSAIDDGDNRSRFWLRSGVSNCEIVFEMDGGSGGSVPPASFTVFRGIELTGAVTDFELSDDVRAEYNPGFTINDTEAPVWLIFDAVAPTATEFFVESQAGTPGLTYTVEAFDWPTASFAEIATQDESFNADQVFVFPIGPDNIDVGGEVRGRVGWRQTGFIINFPWVVRVDQAGWNQ